MNLIEIIFLIIFIILLGCLSVYAMWFVHLGLNRCYLAYALRYCRKNHFTVSRFRGGPAIKKNGVKTEFTIIEFDCFDADHQRKLIRLIVWIFGIRHVSVESFPDIALDVPWNNLKMPKQRK